jgi:hypothetical protein
MSLNPISYYNLIIALPNQNPAFAPVGDKTIFYAIHFYTALGFSLHFSLYTGSVLVSIRAVSEFSGTNFVLVSIRAVSEFAAVCWFLFCSGWLYLVVI